MIRELTRAYAIAKNEGPRSLYYKTAWWISEFFRVAYATVTVRHFTRGQGPEQLVNFVFTNYGGALRPLQFQDEMTRLVRLVADRKPEAVLEIGTARGGALLPFCRAAADDAIIISIDLPYGMFGGGYASWRASLYKRFARPGQKLFLLRSDSHDEATRDRVKKALEGRQVEILWIDGDHAYEGVKKDFEMYAPLVGNKGMIAMHDIAAHPPETGCEVHRFWEEIKARYRHDEFITGGSGQKCFGTGVLYID